MNLDISSILLSKGITNISDINIENTRADIASAESQEEFEKTLTEAIKNMSSASSDNTKMTEMEELISALDKSILGSVMSDANKAELASELAEDSANANDVVSQLTKGHMESIVMSNSDDDENAESSMSSSLNDYEKQVESTETLSDRLESIMTMIGQTSV